MSCDCHLNEIAVVRDGALPVKWCYKCGKLFGFNIWAPEQSHPDKCTHPASALKRGARWEWCGCCGAVRTHRSRKPETFWMRPVGAYGGHPGSLRPIPPKKPKEPEE